MTEQSSGARRQARQRAKGRPITVILPPQAADALDQLRVRHDYTQGQAISAAVQLLLERLDATPTAP